MHSGLFRDRRAATIVAASAAAALLFLLWRPSAGGGTALDLALGIFGGVAAALTFALALLVAGTDVWPPARALVLRPTTVAWFALSTIAIAAAVASALTDTSALQDGLTKASVIGSFLAGAYGVAGIVATLTAVSGSGRRELHARVIRGELRRVEHRSDELPRGLADLLPSAAEALANGVFARFIDRGEDILLAARQACAGEPALLEAERLSHICLGYEALLARALARHEAAPEISWLLGQLARETACLTGHVQYQGGTFRAARLLAGQTRMLNWLASAASARGHIQPQAAEEMRSFIAACERSQDHVRACADPDPPLQHLPTKHPWHGGIRDCPDATLLWLIAACEQGTQMAYGSALYVAHESLFGDKYFGDYQYGRAVPDIQARVRSEDNARLDPATLLTQASGHGHSRPIVEAWGGVDLVWVTVLAIRMAELAPAHWTATEEGYQGPGWLVDDRQELADRWRFLVPELQDPSPSAALVLAARCLGRKANTTGLDPWRRAWLDQQHAMAPPSTPLVSEPAFVLLAVLLALRKSTSETSRSAATVQFLDCLPSRAVAAMLAASGLILDGSTDSRTARRIALGPSDPNAKGALVGMLDEVPVP